MFIMTPEQSRVFNVALNDWWSTLSWNTKQKIRDLYFAVLKDEEYVKRDLQYEQEHPEVKIG